MYTLELMEQALTAAEQLGFGIRHEWLGGTGGGECRFGGRRWIFIDLGLNIAEQLDQVIKALKNDPTTESLALSPGLRTLLDLPAVPRRGSEQAA